MSFIALSVLCGGAFPMSRLSFGALLPVFLLSSLFSHSDAVCVHCKDTIAGCTGGLNCPLVTDLASNVALFEAGTLGSVPKIHNLLPPELSSFFTRSVCEALVGIANAPVGGTMVDLSSGAYSTCNAVVQAAFYGHVTFEEAGLELNARLQNANDANDIAKVKASIDLLKN